MKDYMMTAKDDLGNVFSYNTEKYEFVSSDGDVITKYFSDENSLSKSAFCRLVGIELRNVEDYVILSNQAKCPTCGDSVWSAHRHDYVDCSCGAMSVDGGQAYLRRRGAHIDESVSLDRGLVLSLTEGIDSAKKSRCNSLGILCNVVRTLRDCGYVIKQNEEAE